MVTAAGGRREPLGEGLERLRRHPVDLSQFRLLPSARLSRERVELGVGRQDPDRRLQTREDPRHEFVCVRSEGDGVVPGQAEQGGDSAAGTGHDRSEDVLPLVVHQRGGIHPGPEVGVMRHVRPWVMGVSGEMEAVLIRLEEPGEVVSEMIHDS